MNKQKVIIVQWKETDEFIAEFFTNQNLKGVVCLAPSFPSPTIESQADQSELCVKPVDEDQGLFPEYMELQNLPPKRSNKLM